MDLSLKGYFFACQKASKEMVKRNTAGSLICISSVHSFRAAKDWTPYGIAKMGIRRMVKGLAADLSGTGINSKCYDDEGNCIISCDKNYYRPLEVDTLLGNATKAQKELKWKPKINIKLLVKEMVNSELVKINNAR